LAYLRIKFGGSPSEFAYTVITLELGHGIPYYALKKGKKECGGVIQWGEVWYDTRLFPGYPGDLVPSKSN